MGSCGVCIYIYAYAVLLWHGVGIQSAASGHHLEGWLQVT